MNEELNEEILLELRRLRRVSQCSFICTCLLVFVMLAVYFGFVRTDLNPFRPLEAGDFYQQTQQSSTESRDVWADIQLALDRADNREALSLAKALVARQPNYHYAYANLGSVYIAMNDFTNAEAAYVKAVELFPAEEHEKALAAIQKRLEREREARAK